MTRESYDKATSLLDKILKIERVVKKMKQEFPETQYDPDYRNIFEGIFNAILLEKQILESELKKL